MLKCKHRCHCACSSEIGTYIINDAGRQAAPRICILYKSLAAHTKKNPTKIYVFSVESRQTRFHVLKVYINFQQQQKTFTQKYEHTGTIPIKQTTTNFITGNPLSSDIYTIFDSVTESENDNFIYCVSSNGNFVVCKYGVVYLYMYYDVTKT